ncbi:MAG: GGDEF domain-containing protein [Desulfarculaceae bacterium]|nr:GGDEF domain-containing protein [Desulfarculaceae bacterium]MCF8071541.1 GGDEF domain-containing protein [Desulfarculaceae bacterium]MCF8102356.1 GGDEF domain-containing protein [Desulfarculaceae bacterium]MCF8114820.1 GGDEF domain-containing protein [Desulfarculaceae bacterium]
MQAPAHQAAQEDLSRGRALGLLLVSLPSFILFRKLFGQDMAEKVMAQLGEILRSECNECLSGYRALYLDRADDSSFTLLLRDGEGLSLDLLANRALQLKLGARNRLNKQVMGLTGQSLSLNVGYALVEDRGGSLENSVYQAIWDARQIGEGALSYNQLSLMNEFHALITGPQLHAVYQPIVGLSRGEVLGWEALARGPEESHFAHPQMMFEFAEEVGNLFNLERACRRAAVDGLGGLEPEQKLFLNIHPQTVGDPDFKNGETKRLLARHGLKPGNVVFEITERHTIRDFTNFHRTLDHYRSQGYLVAIDDAGTGYSGLSRMALIRPDYIKVDMSLIHGIESNPVQRALMETLVTLAERIGCLVVAEGIQTATEFSCLLSMGVHYGQGFLIARPQSPKPPPSPALVYRPRPVPRELEWKCSLPVGELLESAPAVNPTDQVRQVKAMLDASPISGVVVVEDGQPQGLVMSHHLDRQLGSYYGTALYYERPVSRVMDSNPLVAEDSTPVEVVASKAMSRERFKVYDHIVVTRQGRFRGVVSVQKMLDALARVQVEMAKGANPLTGLPGGVALEQAIEQRCGQGRHTSLIYVDLDHFKVFNDSYGFDQGDKMLNLLARILVWAAKRHGEAQSMVGHVGGDDFVVLTSPNRAERLCRAVVRCFQRLVPGLYSEEDRKRGHVQAKGRDGRLGRYPLVSASLGIVDCQGCVDLGEIGRRAAEVKRYAKSQPGNVYVRDRRSPLGISEENPSETTPPEPKTSP